MGKSESTETSKRRSGRTTTTTPRSRGLTERANRRKFCSPFFMIIIGIFWHTVCFCFCFADPTSPFQFTANASLLENVQGLTVVCLRVVVANNLVEKRCYHTHTRGFGGLEGVAHKRKQKGKKETKFCEKLRASSVRFEIQRRSQVDGRYKVRYVNCRRNVN